jgi:hypothetical protein
LPCPWITGETLRLGFGSRNRGPMSASGARDGTEADPKTNIRHRNQRAPHARHTPYHKFLRAGGIDYDSDLAYGVCYRVLSPGWHLLRPPLVSAGLALPPASRGKPGLAPHTGAIIGDVGLDKVPDEIYFFLQMWQDDGRNVHVDMPSIWARVRHR